MPNPPTPSALPPRSLHALDRCQKQFPLSATPFADMAALLGDGWTASELLQLLQSARQAGLLSRLGAVFAPNTVGSSTLAALAVPPERLDAVAAFVSSHAEVNHNYQRDHHFNLWFVVTASDAANVAEVLSRIHLATGLEPLNLPLLREYHIDLGFALDGSTAERQPQRQPDPIRPDWRQQRLLAALRGGLPLQLRPFQLLATGCGLTEQEVLRQLQDWQVQGVLRRFGAVLRHAELGYRHNAMCVWQIDDAASREAIARRLATEPAVTLCYERPARPPHWPYQLFCMIHALDAASLQAALDDLIQRHGLQRYPHAVLPSLKRYTQRGACYGHHA
ncbi:Lrp/AsnC family transcriptional regulator [Aquitalea palustris]|uniref:siroheme decarboxylase n=1 Tax=Aquitalea palustris TaxID=2480983 RepID=A0A454JMT9_9NEIS|nr:Lrp/AsnC family transcriptional regulator [Aquitalea palustris]RMD01503.1 Lrp/AsnC family transcriptional regulator [Aquitalea palustris]